LCETKKRQYYRFRQCNHGTHDLREERGGSRYWNRRQARLAANAANSYTAGATNFLPKDGVLVTGKSDADWKAISGFLDAVSAYADALAKANDPSLVTGLTGKVSSVGTALSKVAAARNASPTDVQRITTIGAIVSDLVGVATNLYASVQIQAAMTQAQPILDSARAPLRDAINAVIQDSRRKLEDYRVSLRCKLLIARGDYSALQCPKLPKVAAPPVGQSTSIEQYDSYIAASQDYLALNARVSALKGIDKAIDDMISGHEKLKDNLDNTAALTQFLQSVGDIADNLAKLEALKKTASK
jgi:hypothetical protein